MSPRVKCLREDCPNTFQKYRKWQRFCSQACRYDHNNQRKALILAKNRKRGKPEPSYTHSTSRGAARPRRVVYRRFVEVGSIRRALAEIARRDPGFLQRFDCSTRTDTETSNGDGKQEAMIDALA